MQIGSIASTFPFWLGWIWFIFVFIAVDYLESMQIVGWLDEILFFIQCVVCLFYCQIFPAPLRARIKTFSSLFNHYYYWNANEPGEEIQNTQEIIIVLLSLFYDHLM